MTSLLPASRFRLLAPNRIQRTKSRVAAAYLANRIPDLFSKISDSPLSRLRPETVAALALGGILRPGASLEDIESMIDEVQKALGRDKILDTLRNLESLIGRDRKNPLVSLLKPSATKGGVVIPLTDFPSPPELARIVFLMIAKTGVRATFVVENASDAESRRLATKYGKFKDLNGNLLSRRLAFVPAGKNGRAAAATEQAGKLAHDLKVPLGQIVVLWEGELSAAFGDRFAATMGVIRSDLKGHARLAPARDYVALLVSTLTRDEWLALNRTIKDVLHKDEKTGFFEMSLEALKVLDNLQNEIFRQKTISVNA